MAAAGRPSYLLDAVRLAVVLCFCVSLVRIAHVSNLHGADEEGRASGKQTDAAALGLAAARRLSGVAGQRGKLRHSEEYPCKTATSSMTDLPAFYEDVALDVPPDATAELHNHICAIQNAPGAQPRAAVFADDGQLDKTHCGIGCRLMRVVMCMWESLADHKPIHSSRQAFWEYTDGKRCPPRNEECYFQQLAGAPLPPHLDAHLSNYNSTGLHKVARQVSREGLEVMTRKTLDTFREGNFGRKHLNDVLESQRLRKVATNGCYLSAQLLRFIATPNAKLDKLVAETKTKMRWNEGGCVVAMHVRHGWRAATNAHLWPDEYMRHAKKTGCKRILIMTENQKVIDEAHEKFPAYEFLYTDYPRDNHRDIGKAMAAGEVSQEPEALNALVNLYLSADCQYHIGTPNSTWLRLMMMLAMAKLGHLPSYAFVGEKKYFTEQNGRWGFFALCDKPELYALTKKNYKRFPRSQMVFDEPRSS